MPFLILVLYGNFPTMQLEKFNAQDKGINVNNYGGELHFILPFFFFAIVNEYWVASVTSKQQWNTHIREKIYEELV